MNRYDLASTSRGHGFVPDKNESRSSIEWEKENIDLAEQLGFDCKTENQTMRMENEFEKSSPLRKNKFFEQSPLPSKYMNPSFCVENRKTKGKIIRLFMRQLTHNSIFDQGLIDLKLAEIKKKYGESCESTCRCIYKNVKKDLLKANSGRTTPDLVNLTSALDRFINGIEDIQQELDELKSNC